MRITREDVEDFQNPENIWFRLLNLRKSERNKHGKAVMSSPDLWSKSLNDWEMDQLTMPDD